MHATSLAELYDGYLYFIIYNEAKFLLMFELLNLTDAS